MEIVEIKKPAKEQKDFVKLIEKGDYFNEMGNAIMNSPTASMAVLMFKKYCVLPNIKPAFAPSFEKIKDEKIKFGFFTVWVEYDVDLSVKAAHFRLSKNYRVKCKDDLGKASQYLNVNTKAVFPAFNSDKKVVAAQVEKAGGFGRFTGQIYQYNTTTANYEYSVFFPVFKWMEIEADTPTFITASADNALFGNNIFVMKKAAETSAGEGGEGQPKVITNTDTVVSALRQAKTVKNSGTNHVLTVNTEEPIDKVFMKVPIGNDIELDKFNNVDDKAGKKICTAAYCFPQILANPSEGLFGNSGEAYQAAIDFWAKTCEFEALKIEAAFLEIGVPIQDADPAEDAQAEEELTVDQATLDAQAQLRGSVGGVQALLSIQTSYSQKLTTYSSAIAMIELVFGYNNDEAVRLLGEPVVVGPPEEINPNT
jgi:hypothetical protein